MRKIVLIPAALLAGAVLLAAAVYGFLFHSAPGRSLILNVVERELGEELNSVATISALTGAPPRQIVLQDISLAERGTPWLTVGRLELRWRPFALLRGKVYIERLSIDRVRLTNAPPADEASPEDSEPLSIRLPRDLPAVRVDEIDLSNFTVALNDQIHRFNGGGAIEMGGDHIDTDFTFSSAENFDDINVALNLSPENDRILLNAKVDAKPGGVIAQLVNLDAPLLISATSDSPLAATDIGVNAKLGEYGDAEATITTNLKKLTGADATISFTSGPALAGYSALSKPITANIRAEERQGGGAFLIHAVTGAPGEASGEILWRNRGRFVETLTASFKATLDKTYRQNVEAGFLSPYIDETLNITVELGRARNDYNIDATIESGETTLTLTDGRTNLDNILSGKVSLQVPPLNDTPTPLSLGAEAAGILDLNTEASLSLRALAIGLGDESSLNGDIFYSFADEALNISGDLIAEPAFMSALSPSINPTDATTGEFSLSGTLERFTLNTTFEAPALQFDDDLTPPFILTAAFAGLPSRPTGDIKAEAKGSAEGRFETQIRSSVDGLITIPKLDYSGAGFLLSGSGSINPVLQNLELDLAYKGDERAKPLPGFALAGSFQAQGALSTKNGSTDLNFSAPNLAVNDNAFSGLSLAAEGQTNAIELTLGLQQLSSGGNALIDNLTAEAILTLQDLTNVSLNSLDAVILQNETQLTAPAEFRFDDGVAIDNLRVAYGEKGSITLDGAFSSSQWRAALALSEVNIPEADGLITLNLTLDTDQQNPATGDFQLQSLLVEGEDAKISGGILWDGTSVILSNEQDADELDMRIALPAQLKRAPELTIITEGPLDGYARYSGALEAIAAYLPPPLQTLEGDIAFDMTLSGDTNAPQIIGRGQIAKGQYTELQSGFSLVGLHLDADATYAQDGSVVTFTGGARGAGQSGDDTITLTGDLDLSENSMLNLNVAMTDAVLSAQPVDMVRANGAVSIAGPLDAIKAEGEITIDELDAEIITPETTALVDIEVVAYNGAEDMQSSQTAHTADPGIDYNVRVVADDRIFVRGRGLESEWSADIAAVNDNNDPLIIGAMRLRRGWLDFSGRRFNLTRGVITFDRLSANNPLLDIRAEYETGDGVTAIIAVTGRGETPEISLQSVPEQPSEDIMALILFGKPAQELGPVETLQIAEALASLSGIGPFGGQGVTGRLRQALRLDLLNIDPDLENGGGALTVGKYVTDGVFISATQDAQGRNGSVRVEYEVTDNISVETEIAQDGEQTVSANWKRDF